MDTAILSSALDILEQTTGNSIRALHILNHIKVEICENYHSAYPNVKPDAITQKQVKHILGETLEKKICH